jgi:hypothetical protein
LQLLPTFFSAFLTAALDLPVVGEHLAEIDPLAIAAADEDNLSARLTLAHLRLRTATSARRIDSTSRQSLD